MHSPAWLNMRAAMDIGCLAVLAAVPLTAQAQTPTTQAVPVFEIERAHSSIKFDVKASVNIAGKFDTWDASLTFASPDETTGVLEIKNSGCKRGHRKWHEERQAQRQGLLRRRAESANHL